MKRKTLTYIILLATFSIAGVLSLQFFFLRKSHSYSEKQFLESVTVALKEVAWQILVANGKTENFENTTTVEMISKSYYMVQLEGPVDPGLLKFHLIEEFKRHQIFTDFEFAIFNPSTEILEQGTYVSADGEERISDYSFPQIENIERNYFTVHFPDMSPYFSTHLSIWYLFTGLLLVVVIFFGYTLSVIIRQRQLSEIQKNFINNLTHELKTPISSIALSANVIADKKILQNPERLFEYARIIQEQNKRLSTSVEKVLNLASLEKNKIHLNREKIEPGKFLEGVIDSFKMSDPGRKASVHLDIKDKYPFIIADKFHFANLVTNIIENSAKYCETTPEITIEIKTSGNNLVIYFCDNGIGIPKRHRKKIFKRFYRVPTGNVHNVKGFGLGLDYVRKIVKAHDWKIKVDDNPKGGSIFVLIIPIKK
jgi:two-component system, OmpR family, phosphate regulon sensor histidine kinase PhoR